MAAPDVVGTMATLQGAPHAIFRQEMLLGVAPAQTLRGILAPPMTFPAAMRRLPIN